jgi:hypothetical protein
MDLNDFLGPKPIVIDLQANDKWWGRNAWPGNRPRGVIEFEVSIRGVFG